MKTEVFKRILELYWNKPDFTSALRTLLGPNWQKKVQELRNKLNVEEVWKFDHQLGVSQKMEQVRPYYPLLHPEDVSENRATLGLSSDFRYTRLWLDQLELIPFWDLDQDKFSSKGKRILAWEVPCWDPELRFNESSDYLHWNLEVRVLTNEEILLQAGKFMLGNDSFGTLYLSPEFKECDLRKKSWELIRMLGDGGEGLEPEGDFWKKVIYLKTNYEPYAKVKKAKKG